MDAAGLTPERRRELAALRVRAYGPNADIYLDVVAVERLRELEQLTRSHAAIPDHADNAGAAHAQEAARAAPMATAAAVIDDSAPDQTSPDHTSTDHPRTAPVKRVGWWRPVPIWAVGVVAAIVAGVVWVVPGLVTSGSDATLRIVDDAADVQIQPRELLDWYSLDEDSLRRHDDFHGINIWSAMNTQGSQCLLLSMDSSWTNASCTPPPLEPALDFVMYDGMPPVDGLDLPTGSVLRFALRGDVVDVAIAPAEQEADAPSPEKPRFADPFA